MTSASTPCQQPASPTGTATTTASSKPATTTPPPSTTRPATTGTTPSAAGAQAQHPAPATTAQSASMPASPVARGEGDTAAHLAHHQDISTYFKREADRTSTLEGLVRQLQAAVADLQKRLDH